MPKILPFSIPNYDSLIKYAILLEEISVSYLEKGRLT